MSQAINLSWTPPAAADWNFAPTTQVCAAASRWTGTLIEAISISEAEGIRPVPISYSVEYLYTILPSEYRDDSVNTSLAAWYYDQHLLNTTDERYWRNFWDDFEDFPLDNCQNELCPKIGWEEDPDLAGVGMLISYYIVAGLTTFYYLLLLLPDRLQEDRSSDFELTKFSLLASSTHDKDEVNTSSQGDNFGMRILKALRKTLNNFLLADLIFTVGMLGAALWRFYTASHRPEIPYSTFNQLISFFMSCYSVLSCLVLQAVARPDSSDSHVRHHYRWNLALPWVAIVPMTVVLAGYNFRDYLGLVGDSSEESILRIANRTSELGEWVWLSYCDPWQTRRSVEIVLYAGLVLLAINALWYFTAFVRRVWRLWRGERRTRRGAKGDENNRRPWVTKAFRYTRLFDGFGCAVMMWAFLIMFHIYRNNSHNNAKDSDGGSKDWSFGQILALAAWAPTLVELFNRIFLHPLVDRYHKVLKKNRRRGAENGGPQLPGGHRFESSQTV